jgi:hypothetical protein
MSFMAVLAITTLGSVGLVLWALALEIDDE